MKTGRKSIEELSVVSVNPDARLQAPEHLTEAQATEWKSIVDSLPADYFRPGDVPLLAAFCTASAFYKEAQAHMAEHGMVITDDHGRMRANPASQILTTQASSMAQMAVKLRLCPSARNSAGKAGRDSEGSGQAKRPWATAA